MRARRLGDLAATHKRSKMKDAARSKLNCRTESPPSWDSLLFTTTSPYSERGKFHAGLTETAAARERPA